MPPLPTQIIRTFRPTASQQPASQVRHISQNQRRSFREPEARYQSMTSPYLADRTLPPHPPPPHHSRPTNFLRRKRHDGVPVPLSLNSLRPISKHATAPARHSAVSYPHLIRSTVKTVPSFPSLACVPIYPADLTSQAQLRRLGSPDFVVTEVQVVHSRTVLVGHVVGHVRQLPVGQAEGVFGRPGGRLVAELGGVSHLSCSGAGLERLIGVQRGQLEHGRTGSGRGQHVNTVLGRHQYGGGRQRRRQRHGRRRRRRPAERTTAVTRPRTAAPPRSRQRLVSAGEHTNTDWNRVLNGLRTVVHTALKICQKLFSNQLKPHKDRFTIGHIFVSR